MAVRNRRASEYAERTTGSRTGRVHGESYVYGTAAPKLEPDREPRRQRESERRANVRQQQRIRRNQEKALHMDLPYVIMLTIASLCTLYLCVNYLHLQSSITGRMHNIESLEASLDQMKRENDALETSIETSIDLNEIYRVATEELGMVYANKDQVMLFDKTESEYVRQYEDIPEY